jgi:hypothetical protein
MEEKKPTCNSEPERLAMSMAVLAAEAASPEPSVARRILAGKIPISRATPLDLVI